MSKLNNATSFFLKKLFIPFGGLIVFNTGNSQVNLQTGSATFSIPMFNWQDHKSNLTTAVGLSYNSGNGLKVSDVASEVGQGWNLIGGGVITRMQVGEPDDQIRQGSEINELVTTKYPAGYLYASNKAYQGCPEVLTKYPLYHARNKLYKQLNSVAEDKQLDYFTFQFNGKSGMFILNAAPGVPGGPAPEDVGIPLGDTKLKITFQRDPSLINQGIRTTITSFTIQDVDGIKYKFSRHGLTQLLDSKYFTAHKSYAEYAGNVYFTNTNTPFSAINATALYHPDFKPDKVFHQTDFETASIPNKFIIGSWYLTEILDPLTEIIDPLLERKVTFNYSTTNINSNAGSDLTYNENGNYSTVTHKKTITQTPQLETIVFPDGHTVIFHHEKPRVDLTGANALTAVDIRYGIRYISKYLINTTYFILNRYGKPETHNEKIAARLCLKSVQKIGIDLKEDSPPYIFDYYLTSGTANPDDHVPAAFTFKKDIWGYYNGNFSLDYNSGSVESELLRLNNTDVRGLCFSRSNNNGALVLNPKPNYAKNGLLRQIIYPTGGTLTYQYEQNMGVIGGVYQNVGGVHVSHTSSTDAGYSNGCDNPVTTAYRFVLDEPGSPSSMWGLEMPENKLEMKSFYNAEGKHYKIPIFGGCGLFGCCKYRFEHPGILSVQQATSLSDFMQSSVVLSIAGNISTLLNANNVFSGVKGASPMLLVFDVIVGIYTLIKTCSSNPSRDVTTNVYQNFDLNSISPLPTQFKRVEIVEHTGAIGKTVHEFTSDADYPVWEPSNPTFSNKQRFGNWLYGLPKSTTVFNNNGNIVKQTINQYDPEPIARLIGEYNPNFGSPNASGLRSNLISCKCLVTKTSSQNWEEYLQKSKAYNTQGSGVYIGIPGNSDMKVSMNGYYTGRLNLITTKEQTYSETNPLAFVESVTRFTYNDGLPNGTSPGNYEVASVGTTQTNGDYLVKEFVYSGTYNSTDPVISILAQHNIVAVPLATTTKLYKGGPNGTPVYYISDTKTELTQLLPTGLIKPLRIWEKRFAVPAQNPSATPYTEVKTFTYDVAGNLVGVKEDGGRTITNMYDHQDKFITATVINADATNDKVAYTSFETTNLGNWSLSGTVNYTTVNTITGSQSLSLGSGNILSVSGLNTGKSYKLTFWSTAPLSVTAALTSSGPAINGFTYYEYAVSSSASGISITGTANLDEVRLLPKGARMSTTTYDPLIGKTSACDQNNRITYYDYDALGRLRFIKDEKRSIVKMYEYNNVSKQNGCPGIYYSKYICKPFIKNNCGPGFVGSTVYYCIPANTYTSAISQADADAQAAAELAQQAQAYANELGTCIPIYCNEKQTITVYTEDCPPGYKGGAIIYEVPAGRYCSTVSLQAANQMALDEIAANAQAFANDPDNAICVVYYDPEWEAEENAPTECRLVNGVKHRFVLATDVNPNSPTYNQQQWKDLGPDSSCQ